MIIGNTNDGFKAKRDLENLNNGNTGFTNLREAVNKLVFDSRNKIARERCNQIKNRIRDFNGRFCDVIKSDFDIDFNTPVKETLEENEMNRIYNEWWAQMWQRLKEEFQIFYHNEIRTKTSEDLGMIDEKLGFKELYDKLVDKTIRDIPATRRLRQEEIYPLSIGDDGVDNPKKANTLIRDELALDSINSLDKITIELNGFLYNKINKIVDWIRSKLWNLPEVRETMIGKNEEMENLLLKKAFDALIQRLARPATNIFLKYPRSRIERSKVINEYQMEIIIINSFVMNGRILQRGIVNFLANGKLGHFDFDSKSNHNDLDDLDFDLDQNSTKSSKFYTKSADNFDSESITSTKKKGLALGLVAKTKLKLKRTGATRSNGLAEDTDTIVPNSPHQQMPQIEMDTKHSSDLRLNQFDGLMFSRDAENLSEIQAEIEQDVEEFIACMKNSIYYGSGIQRFLYQELDKIRRRFFYIEDAKRGWWSIIDNHLKDKNSNFKIPAPLMADEIAKRSYIIKSVKEIKSLTNEL